MAVKGSLFQEGIIVDKLVSKPNYFKEFKRACEEFLAFSEVVSAEELENKVKNIAHLAVCTLFEYREFIDSDKQVIKHFEKWVGEREEE